MLGIYFDQAVRSISFRREHFFVSGQTTQVNAPALLGQPTVIVVTIRGLNSKKQLDFPGNKPILNLPPRPGSGSSGLPVPGILPLPTPVSPPTHFWDKS